MRKSATPALEFLTVATPPEWFDAATQQIPNLLIDHANCEKKAASTALSLLYRYVEYPRLLNLMSRLAREELRHFEQVLDVMQVNGVTYIQMDSSRYAGQLHKLVSKSEPQRVVDVLILGAVVEARSCERFVGLVEVLPTEIGELYQQLVHSEARHFEDYLSLAVEIATANALSEEWVQSRINRFLDADAHLITTPDAQFRFHSGVPGKNTPN